MSTEDVPHTPFAAGSVVAGRLRIVRVIGVGGMGTVYEVEHELTKHRRALKVLHPKAALQASVIERFVREASAAARVANAHVAETFDAGRLDSGEPYLLMELLEGETLDQRLGRTGTIDLGELTDLVHQACEGVHAAHAAGIVHRDLKPENLIVTVRDGAEFLKILDFGISKFDSERTGTLGITAEGLVIGTPYYMSPEQVLASPTVDARTDVYALGVILYECACGVRPFEALSVEHLAVLVHEGKATPLEARRPELPPAFCAAVQRAMAVDPEARFASARDLADAIAPFRDPAAAARPASWTVPPRVVIRASGPPPSDVPSRFAPAVTTSSGTASGFAETKAMTGGDAASALPARAVVGRAWRPVVAVAAIVAAAIAGALVLSASGPHAQPSAASAGPTSVPAPRAAPVACAAPEAATQTGTVVLAAPTVTSPNASSMANPPSAHDEPPGAAATAGHPTVPPAPSAHPSAATSAPASTAPGPKSRVDQNGLAGENPFR